MQTCSPEADDSFLVATAHVLASRSHSSRAGQTLLPLCFKTMKCSTAARCRLACPPTKLTTTTQFLHSGLLRDKNHLKFCNAGSASPTALSSRQVTAGSQSLNSQFGDAIPRQSLCN